VINVNNLRKFIPVIAVIAIGIATGLVYVHALDGQKTYQFFEVNIKPTERNQTLEKQAIALALADSRIKPLANVSGAQISATVGQNYQIIFDNNSTKTGNCTAIWDGKYTALVTIKYPDNSGYGVEVNITDKIVGDPKKGVWDEGNYFKYLP
jgi:3-isopropylmalate dehydratase small subunit